MEYFTLSHSTLTKEIGRKYPQCKGVPYGYTLKWFENVNSMTKLSNDQFPDFIPDLKFELEESAKLSDMISPSNLSARGILCNTKMLNLLMGNIMDSHKVFDAKILFNDVWHKYHWIHFIGRDIDFIDMENSIFHKWVSGLFKEDEVHFSTYEECIKISIENNYASIRPSRLAIKENFKRSINEIFFLRISNSIIVSEKIADIINKNKLTGIHLERIC